jgi:hypothetical protein
MKPTTQFNGEFLKNEDKFRDEFFKRFTLSHAPIPLKLDDEVTKDYLFPTLYGDVTCAMAIFLCSYERAEKMMLHPRIKPVKMTRGRSLVAFSCYEYKNVMNVAPYNEIAMTIPVMVDPGVNVPVLPMILPVFKNFGYYVFSMPVTSLENQIRGLKIWGLPKVVQEIDLREECGDCVTTAMEESGEPYLELRVPMGGAPQDFDVSSCLYSRRGNDFFQSQTCFKGSFNVTKHMGMLFRKGAKPNREYIKIHDTPSGRVLRELEIEEHPFQLRFARHLNSCFDLPNPDFKSQTIRFGE